MTPTFIKLKSVDGREITLNTRFIASFGPLRDGRGSWLCVGESGDYHMMEQPEQIAALLGITADAPPPAEPAKPEPDFETLLRNLVGALETSTFRPLNMNSHVSAAWTAAVAAVLP